MEWFPKRHKKFWLLHKILFALRLLKAYIKPTGNKGFVYRIYQKCSSWFKKAKTARWKNLQKKKKKTAFHRKYLRPMKIQGDVHLHECSENYFSGPHTMRQFYTHSVGHKLESLNDIKCWRRCGCTGFLTVTGGG